MNNLKARVWDRKKKKMYYPSFNHILEWHYTLKGEPYFIFFDENFNPAGNKNIDVMLYANLKDKIGKELYSNDIIKLLCHPEYIERNVIAEIRFSRSAWRYFTNEDTQGLMTELAWEISSQNDNTNDYKNHLCELIGNTKENPELLGG